MFGLIFTAALIFVASAQTCDYSSICADHTMCKYPTEDYGEYCLSPLCSGVDAATQQQIVDLHNELRRKVAKGLEKRGNPGPQPPASNMREFIWDEELATIAQRWTNQCLDIHDTCRDVGSFFVGQNLELSLSITGSTECTQDWAKILTDMYNKVVGFNKNHISPFKYDDYNTGFYTQIAWADTYKVGCGFTAFTRGDGIYRSLYVCNYGPNGNYEGGNMYKIGGPCTECPTYTVNCKDGLCG